LSPIRYEIDESPATVYIIKVARSTRKEVSPVRP